MLLPAFLTTGQNGEAQYSEIEQSQMLVLHSVPSEATSLDPRFRSWRMRGLLASHEKNHREADLAQAAYTNITGVVKKRMLRFLPSMSSISGLWIAPIRYVKEELWGKLGIRCYALWGIVGHIYAELRSRPGWADHTLIGDYCRPRTRLSNYNSPWPLWRGLCTWYASPELKVHGVAMTSKVCSFQILVLRKNKLSMSCRMCWQSSETNFIFKQFFIHFRSVTFPRGFRAGRRCG